MLFLRIVIKKVIVNVIKNFDYSAVSITLLPAQALSHIVGLWELWNREMKYLVTCQTKIRTKQIFFWNL